MRYGVVFVGLVALVAAYAVVHAQSFSANSLVPDNLTSAINSTEAFVGVVNQSAYVAFYPNMTVAGRYLAEAKRNASEGNYAQAYSLLALARDSASQQLQRINGYRYATFAVLAILLVASTLFLRRVMRPLGGRRKG